MALFEFDSTEELFEWLAQRGRAAQEAAKDHPIKVSDLRHGDCFVSPRPDHGVVVFGEVLERTEYPEDAADIKVARLNGYVYGRCYSPLCVDGEYGDTHITRVAAKVSREVFERAKANGWRHLEPTN